MITGMPRIAIAVHNFDAAVQTFRDKLGLPVIDLSESTTTGSLGARLAMCVPPGGSNIELMCPASPDMPLAQSLGRFLGRRGEGLFALMLEAPDPDAEAERLLDAGLNVLPLMAGAGGRDVHPGSTHGVLIRVYPSGSFQGDQERHDTALDLSGIMRVMIVVSDLDDAIDVYGVKLGLKVDPATVDAAAGTRSAIVHPPTGGVIELVSPQDPDQPLAASLKAHLQAKGEGLFALVLHSSDPASAAGILATRGMTMARDAGDKQEISPDDTFGARIYIEKEVSGRRVPPGGRRSRP